MKISKKKEKLLAIRKELERSICSPDGYVKNVGSVFFTCYDSGCVLRDKVYYRSKAYGLEFEVLSMDCSYFAGSKAHAEALKEAFGGKSYPSEFCSYANETKRELWIWEGPERQKQIKESIRGVSTPLDYEEVIAALF